MLYRLSHFLCRWVSDPDGDVGLELFRVLTLTKYKEHTIYRWFKNYPDAGRWQGYQPSDDL